MTIARGTPPTASEFSGSGGTEAHSNKNCRARSSLNATRQPRKPGVFARCYTPAKMYAQKLQAEVVIGGKREPVPLEWLDSFCMRNFTGSGEFDDTLPTGEGRLEAGSNVNVERLAAAMSEWLTKRGKGNGQAVVVEIREDK
jgi:hypothetical protein